MTGSWKLNSIKFEQEVHNKMEMILKVVRPLSRLYSEKSKDSKGYNKT